MKKISVSVFIDRNSKSMNLRLGSNSDVLDLLKVLKINPVTVITTRNNELIPEDEKLKNDDEIRVLSVISGG